jgi:hypothetical protein
LKYYELIDDLMGFYTSGDFGAEAVQAKTEFFNLAGMFDEHSPNFEQKMAQFTDWFLFLRKLERFGKPPAVHWYQNRPKPFPKEDDVYFRNLADNRSSLFEFIKISGNDLHVKDFFSEYRQVIRNSPITHGFTREEPFQARLIPHEDSFIFSLAFCFHPPESTKYIRQEIKKVLAMEDEAQKEAREILIVKLFRMRYKYEQYKHVGIKEIYSNESKLKMA